LEKKEGERGEGKESEVGKESEGCCIGDTP
jgi:hypothetical protein